MQKMKSILLTGIGGDIAQGVAKIIRTSRPDLRILGSDIHTAHAGHLFIDQFILLPNADAPNYLKAVRDTLKRYQVDFLFPLTEPELRTLLPLLETCGPSKQISAGRTTIETGLDKVATFEAIKEAGYPTPWTILATDGMPLAYPCIFKRRFGSGSKDIFIVTNVREAAYLSEKYVDGIFQELLGPPDMEVTCAVYRDAAGRVACLHLLRRLSGGLTSWAKSIYDERIQEICVVLAAKLDLRGSMNVQLILTDNGPRIFEINPRVSSTVLMRHKLGFTDVVWALQELDGHQINFPDIYPGQVVVRTYDASLTNLTE